MVIALTHREASRARIGVHGSLTVYIAAMFFMPLVKYQALLYMDKGDTGRSKINTKESSFFLCMLFPHPKNISTMVGGR